MNLGAVIYEDSEILPTVAIVAAVRQIVRVYNIALLLGLYTRYLYFQSLRLFSPLFYRAMAKADKKSLAIDRSVDAPYIAYIP